MATKPRIDDFPTEADIIPRPAANARSPNRKPRTQAQRRFAINRWEKNKAKELFLRIYRVCGNVSLSAERVGRDRTRIQHWFKDDEEFKAKFDKARRTWVEIRTGRFQEMGEDALQVIEEVIDPTSSADDELRVKVAQWVLKSQGIGADKVAKVEHSGPGGGPIPIVGITVHTTPQPELPDPTVVEAEYKEIEEGEEDDR